MPADGYRVPELDSFHLHATTIENDDKMILYLAALDKTVWVDMATVKAWVETGGTGTITPVVTGNKYIHYVSAAEAGGTTVNLPQHAGKNFFLWQEGGRAIDPTQYQILAGGGFKITIPDFQLQEKAQYVLEFYELSVSGGSTNALAKLVTGELPISTNHTLSPTNDAGKLVQLRGGNNQLQLTLFKLEEIEECTLTIIEAQVNNTKEHAIKTQNGQYIYMNGQAYTTIYIRTGEVVWLLSGENGYYVINTFGDNYKALLRPYAMMKVGANEVVWKGQEVLRADYPRAWEEANSLGASIISESTRMSDPVRYRGFFTRGNGTTTFRFPNLLDMSLRGLQSDTGDTDANRQDNVPGGYQKDGVGKHAHGYKDRYHIDNSSMLGSATKKEAAPSGYNGNLGSGDTDADNGTFLYIDATTAESGEEETTVKGIGILWGSKV